MKAETERRKESWVFLWEEWNRVTKKLRESGVDLSKIHIKSIMKGECYEGK